MPISVWTKTSNPSIDPRDFGTTIEQILHWISLGYARFIPNRRGKITKKRAQLLVEHRLDSRPALPAGYCNAALIEGGTVWRVVHQTPRGGGQFYRPGQPCWQMVP